MSVPYTWKMLGMQRTSIANVSFFIGIWFKDGRYKYELKDFYIKGDQETFELGTITNSDETDFTYPSVSKKKINDAYYSIKIGVQLQAESMISNLKNKMSAKSSASDW